MAKKEFEIYSIDEDTYKIVSLVNNEELTFKKNVELAVKLSNITADARVKMIKYMKDNGISKDDLIMKRVKNGKTYYDESGYRLLEQGFINDCAMELTRNLFNVLFEITPEKMIEKLGLTDNDEANRLGTEVRQILLGEKTPKKSQ